MRSLAGVQWAMIATQQMSELMVPECLPSQLAGIAHEKAAFVPFRIDPLRELARRFSQGGDCE